MEQKVLKEVEGGTIFPPNFHRKIIPRFGRIGLGPRGRCSNKETVCLETFFLPSQGVNQRVLSTITFIFFSCGKLCIILNPRT